MKFSDAQVQDILRRVELLISEEGMTKAEFYEKSGIASSQYSFWNTGKNKPKISSIGKMAKALGVSTEYLIYGSSSNGFALNHKEHDPIELNIPDTLESKELEENLQMLDELAVELQIMRENPKTRSLLYAGRHLTDEQIERFADLMGSIPEG